MKILKDKELLENIQTLIECNELNMNLSDMFLSIVGNCHITSKEEIELLSTKFSSTKKDILINKILEYWELDDEDESNNEIISQRVSPFINKENLEFFKNNPYFNNVKINNKKNAKYELKYDHYLPYEIFSSDDVKFDGNNEITNLGYFEEKVNFITLNENDKVWMSITPNEIRTMKEDVENASGNVLVLGLGLGYYPYMISLKESVESITIIEKDQTIIDFFNKYLLPQFEFKNKIKIINNDAYTTPYINKNFNYVFIDIWHNADDGIMSYLHFKNIEKKNGKTFHYWLENSFKAFIKRAFIILLSEQLEGKGDNNYKKSFNTFDEIINKLYFATKDIVIDSTKKLESIMSDSSLINYLI